MRYALLRGAASRSRALTVFREDAARDQRRYGSSVVLCFILTVPHDNAEPLYLYIEERWLFCVTARNFVVVRGVGDG